MKFYKYINTKHNRTSSSRYSPEEFMNPAPKLARRAWEEMVRRLCPNNAKECGCAQFVEPVSGE